MIIYLYKKLGQNLELSNAIHKLIKKGFKYNDSTFDITLEGSFGHYDSTNDGIIFRLWDSFLKEHARGKVIKVFHNGSFEITNFKANN